MSEKRLWSHKQNSIKSMRENFQIAAEIWNFFSKDLRSRVAIVELEAFFHSTLAFFNLTDSLETTQEFLQQQIYMILLYQNEEFSNRRSVNDQLKITVDQAQSNFLDTLTSEETVKLMISFIDFDTFFSLLTAIFGLLVINCVPDLFCHFWEYVYISVIEIKQAESPVTVGTASLRCIQGSMIKDESTFSCFFVAENKEINTKAIYTATGMLDLQKRIVTPLERIGKSTQKHLEDLANDENLQAKFSNAWKEVIDAVLAEEKFYIFFCIMANGKLIYLNLAVRTSHLFEQVVAKGKDKTFYKDLLVEEFYHKIDYIDRFTKLFNARKNPYNVEQSKSLGFENENRSINEMLLKANKLAEKTFPYIFDSVEDIKKDNECFVYQNKVEGLENKINAVEFDFDPLKNKLTGDWKMDQLLRKSHEKPLRILITGKRFSEKSQLIRLIAKLLNIDFLDIDELVSTYMKDLENKILEYNELIKESQNANDGDTDQTPATVPEAPFGMDEFESLKLGNSLSLEFILEIFRRRLHELRTGNKGYIIEHSSLMVGQGFLSMLLNSNLEPYRNIEYIIDMKLSNDDCMPRSDQMIEVLKPGDGDELSLSYANSFALKERASRLKRAEFLKEAEGLTDTQKEDYEKLSAELREYLENTENYNSIPNQQKHKGSLSSRQMIIQQSQLYDILEVSALKDYCIRNQIEHVSINVEGRTMNSMMKEILTKLKYQKFKPTTEIEGSSSLSTLQEVERNLDNGDLRRFWSFYKSIDCVEIVDNSLIKLGSPEFAVDFRNYIFVFHNEDNKKKFLSHPNRYLTDFPMVHQKINMAIFAPNSALVNNIVKEIGSQYNFQLVNLAESLANLIAMFDEGNSKIDGRAIWATEDYFLNINDLMTNVKNGGQVSQADLMKLFLLNNGFELELKFDPDVELRLLSEKVDPKAKKRIIKKEPKPIHLSMLVSKAENLKARSEFYERIKSSGEVSEDVINKIPDISEELSQPMQPKKGFLFYNCIASPEDLAFLEGMGIVFDKIISFWYRSNEEDVYLKTQPAEYDLEKGLSLFLDLQTHLKSTYSSDIFLEIDFTEKQSPYFKTMVIDFMDPFKQKIDSEDFKCNYDFSNVDSGKELLMYGKFGRLCPISLIDRNWFFFCNPANNNVQIDNYIYCFASENFKTMFEKSYFHYISSLNSLDFNSFAENNSRVFVTGAIGSGLRSLSRDICSRTGLELLDLKAELLREKKQYIKEQMLFKTYLSGFNGDEFEEKESILHGFEDSSLAIYSKYEPIDPDADTKFELDLLERLMLSATRKVIMLELYFNEEEQTVFKGSIKEMLASLNLVPDHLIVLKSGEYTSLSRLFNKEKVKLELEEKLRNIRKQNADLIHEKRNQLYLEKLEEDKKAVMEDVEVNESELPLLPEFEIEEELEKIRTNIISRRDSQLDLIKDFVEQFKEPETDIYQINTELPLNKLGNNFGSIWQKVMNKRKLHKYQAGLITVKDNEEALEISCESRIDKMIKSGFCTLSSFGKRNCLRPQQVLDRFDYNLIFNGQVFFVSNENELNFIKENPSFLMNGLPVLKPKLLTPKVAFLQTIADSSLRSTIESRTGLKIISLKLIISQLFANDNHRSIERLNTSGFDTLFTQLSSQDLQIPEIFDCATTRNSDLSLKDIKAKILEGQVLTDAQKVYLIYKAISEAVEINQGFILESFPENSHQLKMLAALDCLPNLVFTMNYTEKEYKEIIVKEDSIFDFDEQFTEFVKYRFRDIKEIEQFFATNFQNLYTLNVSKPWISNFEIINRLLEANLEASFQAVKLFNEGKAYSLNTLAVSKSFISKNMTSEGKFSLSKSITHRINYLCPFSYEYIQYYNDKCLFDGKSLGFSPLKAPKSPTTTATSAEQKIEIPRSDMDNIYFNPSKALQLHEKYNEYCSVCYAKNIVKEGLESLRLVVDSRSHVLFCSLPHLHEFMVSPKLYLSRNVDPKRIVLPKPASLANSMDLQKRLIDEIALIMNHVCQMKLKHPGLTIKQTALVLTSIFLKLRNPLKPAAYRQKYETKLQTFMKICKETQKISNQMLTDFKLPSKYEKENLTKQINDFFNNIDQLRITGQKAYFNQFIF